MMSKKKTILQVLLNLNKLIKPKNKMKTMSLKGIKETISQLRKMEKS